MSTGTSTAAVAVTKTTMEKIALGSQGLVVSKLGYGCMGLTTAYGKKLPDNDVVSMLDTVYTNGINFWDTANLYVYPELSRLLSFRSPIVCQEELIGKSLHGPVVTNRDNIIIATKTGIKLSVFPTLKITPCGDPHYIRSQCNDSLRRLNINCIDLFYLHRIDQTIPIERSMIELKQLVNEGKIKYVGLSECSEQTLRRAHAIHPITCIQMEYSLWCRSIEQTILPTCLELGIGLVAYSPLGRGFFGGVVAQNTDEKSTTSTTKKLDTTDFRNKQERFQQENNHVMYKKIQDIAISKNVTTAQLALAWVYTQQHRAKGVIAIPGTTKEANLLSNIQSLNIILSKDDIDTLESCVPDESTQGSRYGTSGDSYETDNNPPLSDEEAIQLGLKK